MSVNFPIDPNTNDTYEVAGKTYKWDGNKWVNTTPQAILVSTDFIPPTDETISLGSPTNKFKDLYLSGNTIILGETILTDEGEDGLGIFKQNTDPQSQNFGQIVRAGINKASVSITKEDLGLENVVNEPQATVHFFTTTILTTDWSGSGPFTATKNIANIESGDNPTVDIDMSNASFESVELMQENWGLVYRATTQNGSMTFYATEEPQEDLDIRIKVVR